MITGRKRKLHGEQRLTGTPYPFLFSGAVIAGVLSFVVCSSILDHYFTIGRNDNRWRLLVDEDCFSNLLKYKPCNVPLTVAVFGQREAYSGPPFINAGYGIREVGRNFVFTDEDFERKALQKFPQWPMRSIPLANGHKIKVSVPPNIAEFAQLWKNAKAYTGPF